MTELISPYASAALSLTHLGYSTRRNSRPARRQNRSDRGRRGGDAVYAESHAGDNI